MSAQQQQQQQRKFICSYCNAAFLRSTHLSRHETIHRNEKPFECPRCQASFRRLDGLLRHERATHGSSESARIYSRQSRNQRNTALPARPLTQQHVGSSSLPGSTDSSTNYPTAFGNTPAQHLEGVIPDHSQDSAESTNLKRIALAQPHPTVPPMSSAGSQVATIDEHLTPAAPLLNLNWDSPFPELNQRFDVLDQPGGDLNDQLHRLMDMSFLSYLAPQDTQPSPMSSTLVSDPGSSQTITSNEQPDTKTVWKKLEETNFFTRVEKVQDLDHKTYLLGQDLRVSRTTTLNRYVTAYMAGLNQHIPFLHLPTLDLNKLELYEVLALSSIGAVYCFEGEHAEMAHQISVDLLAKAMKTSKKLDTSMLQTLILLLLYSAWCGNKEQFDKDLPLHGMLANSLRRKAHEPRREPSVGTSIWDAWIQEEELRRTCFIALCSLIQLQLLYNIPPSLQLSEVDLPLPCSEEEWCCDNAEKWFSLHTTGPPTPSLQSAFLTLFNTPPPHGTKQYSEFGGFILINAILSSILDARRVPVGMIDFTKFDVALDTWQQNFLADPKNLTSGPSTPFGAMAFNSSAIYRSANIRRVEDYSRIKSLVMNLNDAIPCAEEIIRLLKEAKQLPKGAAMNRALLSSCVTVQIGVTLGLKYLAQTAALSWSVDHMFSNFEVGISPSNGTNAALFLLQWLCGVEKGGQVSEDERKFLKLLGDLLREACTSYKERSLSVRFIAMTYQVETVNVWGITEFLYKVLRVVADRLNTI